MDVYCCYLLLPNLHKFNLSRIIKPDSLSQIVQDFPCPYPSPANSPCDDRCWDPQTPPDPRPICGGPNTNPHEVFDGFWKTTWKWMIRRLFRFLLGRLGLFSGANILVLRECRDITNQTNQQTFRFIPHLSASERSSLALATPGSGGLLTAFRRAKNSPNAMLFLASPIWFVLARNASPLKETLPTSYICRIITPLTRVTTRENRFFKAMGIVVI